MLPGLRQKLGQVYRDLYRASADGAGDFPARGQAGFLFVSSLAEGADRLCIEPGLIPFEHTLTAILPFARAEYEKDFLPEASVVDPVHGTVAEFRRWLTRIGGKTAGRAVGRIIELDGSPAHRPEAYAACSEVLADHSDLLVAVFDGDISTPLGTAATVHAALKRDMPIILLSTAPSGEVSILAPGGARPVPAPVEYTKEQLARALGRRLKTRNR
ncbi:hypothetical protein DND132_2366 [Pseudodesulfovibrio mercurii]|uniref:Uncharacterized protein n=1 Tax=Pseudodesulfovibrio mercurii TaxID=641491 RepID=F0JBR7_9BACT|nr:hypothetical protein [Pseudodesulfovibrio mercurii]EGB15570.1 hypothetical protein DND132_2366 [Pseudodesulfovibrio mercurii]